MLRPSLVMQRIRDACPIFEGRVAGAAVYSRCVDQIDFPAPHAFVLPLFDQGDSEAMISDLAQVVPARFAVIVAVPNVSDDPGFAAGELLVEARDQLAAALIGFAPGEDYAPILYAGMPDIADVTRARAWAQFDWLSETTLPGSPATEEAP